MASAKSAGPNPRRLAVRVLRDVEQRQGFSNRLLSAALDRHPNLDRRDRGLITTLVYGVLRHRARLDHLIDAEADKPRKLKGELRTILRLATYEIVELERPLAIANAEAGKLTRKIDGRGRLARVATAILKGVAARWRERDAAALAGDPVAACTHRWSIPAWLATRWVAQLGPERALARAAAVAEIPSFDLRVDLDRSSASAVLEALRAEQPRLEPVALPASVGEQPQCLRVRGAGDLFYGPTFEAGLVAIQSLGSQQAVRALALEPGEAVLEACAGMGTKTVQIAEGLGRRGRIVAIDRSSERLEALAEQRERASLDAGALTLEVHALELGTGPIPGLEPASFDAVLLDAPCTGLGDLARHPELRWTARPEDIDSCATVQRALLEQVAAYVRPGGRLVYAVCSLEPEEGPAVVEALTAARAEFTVEDSQAWTPETHACDGFWLARLRSTLTR